MKSCFRTNGRLTFTYSLDFKMHVTDLFENTNIQFSTTYNNDPTVRKRTNIKNFIKRCKSRGYLYENKIAGSNLPESILIKSPTVRTRATRDRPVRKRKYYSIRKRTIAMPSIRKGLHVFKTERRRISRKVICEKSHFNLQIHSKASKSRDQPHESMQRVTGLFENTNILNGNVQSRCLLYANVQFKKYIYENVKVKKPFVRKV